MTTASMTSQTSTEAGSLPNGNMDEVTAVLKKHYGDAEVNAWFGHPARLTVEGQPTHA